MAPAIGVSLLFCIFLPSFMQSLPVGIVLRIKAQGLLSERIEIEQIGTAVRKSIGRRV